MMSTICKIFKWLSISSIFLVICLAFQPLSGQAQTPSPDQQQLEIPTDLQTQLPQDPARPPRAKLKTASKIWDIIAQTFKYVFYGLLISAVAALLYTIIREIIRVHKNKTHKDKPKTTPTIPIYQPDAETARIVLDDADRLANAGQYAEAVHTLLFRSIQDIEDKRPQHMKRSLTSREISGLPILSTQARSGFSMISKLVETSFFGDTTLDAQDYALSKTAYQSFAYEKITR